MFSFSPSESESSRGAACIAISGAGVMTSVGMPMSGAIETGGNGLAAPAGGGIGAGGGAATGGGVAAAGGGAAGATTGDGGIAVACCACI